MRHQDLTINHRLESWVYANAAARTGATGFVAGDIGRIAYQTDTGQYWRLTATTPTWALAAPVASVFGRTGAVVAAANDYAYSQLAGIPVYASVQTAQATPAATAAVTPGIMLGLGATGHITPTATGKILVTIAGSVFNAVVGKGSSVFVRYGTGAAPSFGAAPTGTVISGGALAVAPGAPFSLTGVITGAVLGVNLWFDLQLYTDTGGTASVGGVVVSAVELP